MSEQVPVIESTAPEQLKVFSDFVTALREDNVAAAINEAERLTPYFSALSKQLDLDAAINPQKAAAVRDLTSPGALKSVFNAVAARTKNTILSEIAIIPEAVLRFETANETQYSGPLNYKGKNFINFGFIQVFNANRTSGTSFPILAFNDSLMKTIAPHRPKAMLEALQTVATAGNHDMLHHYTNTILNPNISCTRMDKKDFPDPVMEVRDWQKTHFNGYISDRSEDSFESWLMLNHMRVRELMKDTHEEEALKQSCDTFFDELGRIGGEISTATSAKQAHETVDRFGIALLFTMMRYLPLDHPLIDHAIERFQQVDPDPRSLELERSALVRQSQSQMEHWVVQTLANYRAKGVELLPENPDYAALRKLQLIQIEPAIVHLLSPAQPGTFLEKIKKNNRLGEINLDMISTSAAGIWFDLADGKHTFVKPDGTTVEAWIKDGKYHRGNEPARITTWPDGTMEQFWYKNGSMFRSSSVKPGGKAEVHDYEAAEEPESLEKYLERYWSQAPRKTKPGTPSSS